MKDDKDKMEKSKLEEHGKKAKKAKTAKTAKTAKRGKKVIQWQKLIMITGLISMVLVITLNGLMDTKTVNSSMSYMQFNDAVQSGQVSTVKVVGSSDTFTIQLVNGEEYTVINPKHPEFRKELLELGVEIEVQRVSLPDAVRSIIVTLPMLIIMFMMLMYILRYMGSSTATVFKLFKAEEIIGFEAVAGMSQTKKEVQFAVDTLRNHSKLGALGARPTRGIILEGPPGNGKTLIAKAIAGEAGVPFISTSGADFVEMFVGLGAARVRALWSLAILNAPCVIFIDEIDAVGRRRSEHGSNSESNQTLNALLQKMDGLDTNTGILVVGATNLIGDLDSALVRPGRFDKHLYIGPATSKSDRDEIIELYLKTKQCSIGVDVESISKEMFGFTGAEIESTLNEAVIISLMAQREGVIGLADIAEAAMKLRVCGVVSQHTSEKDKITAATHEAGHTIMSLLLGRKVAKVSIVPYTGGVGGMTVSDPDYMEGCRFKTSVDLANDIKILLAGQAAEQLLLGSTSNGCSNDIDIANQIAFKMINDYAMTEESMVNMTSLRRLGVTSSAEWDETTKINEMLLKYKKEAAEELVGHTEDIEELRDRLLELETITDYSL